MNRDLRQSDDTHPGRAEDAQIHPTYRRTNNDISAHTTMKVSSAILPAEETTRLPSSQAVMPQTTPSAAKTDTSKLLRQVGIGTLATLETGLLVIAFIPANFVIQHGIGNWSSTNGPFPTSLAPLVTAFFYLAPFAIGMLARRWDVAILMATVPAWASIGIYIIAASTQNGFITFANGAEPSYLVGTLELFAALGAIGWLMQRTLLGGDKGSKA